MEQSIETVISAYRNRALNQRDFFARLVAVTGSVAAARQVSASIEMDEVELRLPFISAVSRPQQVPLSLTGSQFHPAGH
ncbi:MAG: hypothetical protein WKF30_04155 [Pyrinomonadaceae bacterium]